MDDKTSALIFEIEQQRNWALTRCASLAAEVAELRQKIAELEKPEEDANS